jgi:hypothetical protein
MTLEAVGLVMIAAAVVALVAAAVPVIVRLVRVQRRAASIRTSPAYQAVDGIAKQGRRIGAGAARLQSMDERIEAISRDVVTAATAGGRLGIDVRAVAAATEELLDTFLPSMRGAMRVD